MNDTSALASLAAPIQQTKAAAPARAQAVASAIVAALLGVTLLWGIGFSHIDAVHNAAHDTRHSNGFPCH